MLMSIFVALKLIILILSIKRGVKLLVRRPDIFLHDMWHEKFYVVTSLVSMYVCST